MIEIRLQMLKLINIMQEVESNMLKENILRNNFGLNNLEIQNMPMKTMKYLINILLQRKKNENFEKMVMKNS